MIAVEITVVHRLVNLAGQESHQDGANGETVTLEEAQLTELAGQVVLAGSRRRFELAWPATLPVGPVTAQFDYDS